MPHATLIINPASGRGAGARALARLTALFASHGITDVRTTRAPGDEGRVVAEAVRDGASVIAVAGGDGTWSKAAVALAALGSPASMAFLANGTGNDFAKNLAAPARNHPAMAALVASALRGEAREQRVDLGDVDGHRFLNVAGFGFDVEVLLDTLRPTRLRGNAIYITAALKHLFAYRGIDIDAPLFGDRAPQRRMMLVISNGLNFGGAFRIAPAARIDDGQLDFVSISNVHGLARIPLFVRAMRGAHVSHPGVSIMRAAETTLRFATPPSFELDGELHHAKAGTVVVSTVPAALRVVAP